MDKVERFGHERKRWFGKSNPERMNVSHWEMMVRSGADPYHIRRELGIASHIDNDPDWCFQRFGMTRTVLGDGRIVCVGGEHEDYYDPDFCIYNDVIVLTPAIGESGVTEDSGRVEILGYPDEVFPPTDFHSATLVDKDLFLIGRLGYLGTRHEGVTPLYLLDTHGFSIQALKASGPSPGWIYRHHATYDPAAHAITVRGGKVYTPDAKGETRNKAAHRLYLGDLRWVQISEGEEFRRFVIALKEGARQESPERGESTFRIKGVEHAWLPPEMHGVEEYYLSVSGVLITIRDFYDEARVIVDGTLPRDILTAILKELKENIELACRGEWQIKEVGAFD